MNQELKALGLARHSPVGKKIGNQVWVHISESSKIVTSKVIDSALAHEDLDFLPNIVRFNIKSGDICLIESIDFLSSHEPTVGKTLLIKSDGSTKSGSMQKDPLIYHHKWMFVSDEFTGFNVNDSKKRSINWKSKLGKNSHVSSRIGRKSYWEKWSSWMSEDIIQEFSSANTSINSSKLPRLFSQLIRKELLSPGSFNLDLGGGKFDNVSEALSNIGVENAIYDPFNRSQNHNINVWQHALSNGADTATLSNVLNVIKEDRNKLNILSKAHAALKENGILYVTIYEGDRSEIGRITRKDQWQENKKTSSYLEYCKAIFKSVKVQNGIIICEKNPL